MKSLHLESVLELKHTTSAHSISDSMPVLHFIRLGFSAKKLWNEIIKLTTEKSPSQSRNLPFILEIYYSDKMRNLQKKNLPTKQEIEQFYEKICQLREKLVNQLKKLAVSYWKKMYQPAVVIYGC